MTILLDLSPVSTYLKIKEHRINRSYQNKIVWLINMSELVQKNVGKNFKRGTWNNNSDLKNTIGLRSVLMGTREHVHLLLLVM